MAAIGKLIRNPAKLVYLLERMHLSRFLSDRLYLSLTYRAVFGKRLNWENPQTFSEKLQWLKCYDRKPQYTRLVDKYAVKQYIAQTIGPEYVIPTLGVWDTFDEIPLDTLPEPFVLKCTHDSGSLVICTHKAALDVAAAREKIEKSRRRNFYWVSREWPYRDVTPRIIAEPYLADGSGEELRDYKFFCFDGKVKALFVAADRFKEGEETKFDFYDGDFRHLPLKHGHPNGVCPPERPESFDRMKELAEKLSEGIPHVRIDFYDICGKIYFGEATFFHHAGLVPFDPDEWDRTFGAWIALPKPE